MAASKSTSFGESNINSSTNTSSLTIYIYFSPNNTQTWFASKTLYCTCNGVTQSANVALSQGGSVSYAFTFDYIAHNSDGTKSVSWSWSCATGTSVLGTIGDSGTQTLTTIPRYASITTFTVSKRDETSVTVDWNANATCDAVWYSINNGASWVLTSGINFVISGLSAGTSYNFKIRVRRADSQLTTDSSTYTQSTYNYPYCSSTPDFIIGESVTLSFYNPLRRSMEVTFIADDGSEKSVGTSTETSISGLDGSGWQDFYYQTIPNSPSGIYQIKVEYGNSTNTTNNSNTYTVNRTETPIMASSYFDYESDMTNLTNNNKTIIQGYSNIALSILDEAVPQFYSTITKYVFQIGDQQETITDPLSTATISQANNNVISCTAVDSRNLTRTVSKTVPAENYVQYTTPVIMSATTEREDGVKTTTVLNLSGQIYGGTFGEDGVSNTVQSIKYAVSQDNETWSNWYNIDISNLVITDGAFTIQDYNIHQNGSSGGFPIGIKYYIKLSLEDKLQSASTYTYTTTISSGIIARDVYKDSSNEYHEGINGLADGDYTQTIHGTLNVRDNIYINGEEIGTGGGSSISGGSDKVGMIKWYAGSTAPEGYLICDGSAVSRETYSDLFDIIGTSYGVGDGSTTFNIPNIKGRTVIGLDGNDTTFDTLGETGGEKTHTLTVSEMPNHNHGLDYSIITFAEQGLPSVPNARGGTAALHYFTATSQGGNQPHNNLPPFVVLNAVIKAYEETPTIANVEDSLSSDSTTNAPSVHIVKDKFENMYKTASVTLEAGASMAPGYSNIISLTGEHLVTISTRFQKTASTSNAYTKIATLPVGYRPPYLTLFTYVNESGTVLFCYIDASGGLYAFVVDTSKTLYSITISYNV